MAAHHQAGALQTVSTLRDESRGDRLSAGTSEHISAGSLQRIVDAVEKMAASYDGMRADRDRWERSHSYERAARQRAERRIAALKGHITRLRKEKP